MLVSTWNDHNYYMYRPGPGKGWPGGVAAGPPRPRQLSWGDQAGGQLMGDLDLGKSRIVKRLKGTWTQEAGRGKGKGGTDIQFGDWPLAAAPAPDPVMQDEFSELEPRRKMKKGNLTKRLLEQGPPGGRGD